MSNIIALLKTVGQLRLVLCNLINAYSVILLPTSLHSQHVFDNGLLGIYSSYFVSTEKHHLYKKPGTHIAPTRAPWLIHYHGIYKVFVLTTERGFLPSQHSIFKTDISEYTTGHLELRIHMQCRRVPLGTQQPSFINEPQTS